MSDPENGRGGTMRAAGPRDEEEAPAFRVIDRRRFAPDGSERDQEESAVPPRPEPSAASSTAPTRPAPASEEQPELAMPTGEPYDEHGSHDAQLEPSFGTLLISLSTQALMYLGEIPDLEGGATRKDLAAARNIIDLLGVLERKTAGNLDADEAALLARILYDLRMRFVAISRG